MVETKNISPAKLKGTASLTKRLILVGREEYDLRYAWRLTSARLIVTPMGFYKSRSGALYSLRHTAKRLNIEIGYIREFDET